MNKNKKIKKVTIDDLAVMVAEGFERVDKRFNGVDKRFDKIEEDVFGLKEDVKDIRRDILNLGDRFVRYHTFDVLAGRVKVLEENKK
jgi:archaellum component FlaC